MIAIIAWKYRKNHNNDRKCKMMLNVYYASERNLKGWGRDGGAYHVF